MRRVLLFVILVSVTVFNGCGQGNKEFSARHSPVAGQEVKAAKIVVAGAGSSLDLVRDLAKVFKGQKPDIKIEVPDSIGTAGGIKLLNEGKVDLAVVSRPLTAGEKPGLTYIPFARSAVVFATHSSVKIKNLTPKQIIAIYSGKITNWQTLGGPDANIVVITRDVKASSMQLLAQKLPGFSGVKVPKSALIITSQQNMREALESVPYSIGWVDIGIYDESNLPVNGPALNGVFPNGVNIDRGKYPLIRDFAFVYKSKPSKAVREFMGFVFSPLGRREIVKQGFESI